MGIEIVRDLDQVADITGPESAFGMQGSLVQIQSSRPQIHKEVRMLSLAAPSDLSF
jgi:hypothetical protein